MSPLLTLFIWGKERGEEQKVANWQQRRQKKWKKLLLLPTFSFIFLPYIYVEPKYPYLANCVQGRLLANCKVSIGRCLLFHPTRTSQELANKSTTFSLAEERFLKIQGNYLGSKKNSTPRARTFPRKLSQKNRTDLRRLRSGSI